MTPSTHLKLGALVLLALIAGAATLFVLGIRPQPTETFYTYFDESVHGLEPGALVKFRGVRVGRVGGIGIAPDGRHVEVELQIERSHVRKVDLEQIAPRLRTRLAIVGITGILLVDIEPAVSDVTPRPLPFEPERPYIPSRLSTLAQLQRLFESVGDRLPAIVEQAIKTLERIERVVEDVRLQEIPARVSEIADIATDAVTSLRDVARGIDRADVPRRLAAALSALDAALRRIDSEIARLGTAVDGVEGEDGLVASARRAADSLGELGQRTAESTRDLDRTLRDVRDAARSVRRFFEALERQPDMLVKGRGRARGR